MKAFIERVFKSKKLKEETKVEDKATEAMIESIAPKVTEPRPKHFNDCNCNKCERWKLQNAK
jgi:hypothetical protein